MTNQKGNRGNCGNKCPICKKPIRGYRQWLCSEHRTAEFAAIANAKLAAKEGGEK